MGDNVSSRLLKEQEAAESLRASVQKLRNDRCAGRGVPFVRIGRSIRYLAEDIDKFIMENRVDHRKVA